MKGIWGGAPAPKGCRRRRASGGSAPTPAPGRPAACQCAPAVCIAMQARGQSLGLPHNGGSARISGPVDLASGASRDPDRATPLLTLPAGGSRVEQQGGSSQAPGNGDLRRRQGGGVRRQAGAAARAVPHRCQGAPGRREGGQRGPAPPPSRLLAFAAPAARRCRSAPSPLPCPQREFEKRADPNDRNAQALLDEMRQHIKKAGGAGGTDARRPPPLAARRPPAPCLSAPGPGRSGPPAHPRAPPRSWRRCGRTRTRASPSPRPSSRRRSASSPTTSRQAPLVPEQHVQQLVLPHLWRALC